MKKNLLHSVLFIIVLIILPGSVLMSSDSTAVDRDILFKAQKFKYILEVIKANSADSVDIDAISNAAFKAMLLSIDKHSNYFRPDELRKDDEVDRGSKVGIGLGMIAIADTIVVDVVLSGSSSDSAGIRPGDKIMFIGGKKADGLNLEEAQRAVQGEEGTEVELIIKRGLSDQFSRYNLRRSNVSLSSINTSIVLPGTDVGYISCKRFSKRSSEDFEAVATKLIENDIESIILDLRGNSGGYLERACEIADQFIAAGSRIVYTKASNKKFDYEYTSTPDGVFEDIPVVVLIDGNTASASEIIAGAMQDLDRALLIGEKSYGKGSVQSMWRMKDSSAFRLTVSKYYTPSGRCIEPERVIDSDEVEIDSSFYLNGDQVAGKRITEMMNKFGNRKILPIFSTSGGRPVIGGGGILPDKNVEKDTVTLLTKVMIRKNIIKHFVYNFLDYSRDEIVSEYDDDFYDFAESFEINEEMLKNLQTISFESNIWNAEMFSRDIKYMRTVVKAEIARAIWGNDAYFAIITENDPAVRKAKRLMPKGVIIGK